MSVFENPILIQQCVLSLLMGALAFSSFVEPKCQAPSVPVPQVPQCAPSQYGVTYVTRGECVSCSNCPNPCDVRDHFSSVILVTLHDLFHMVKLHVCQLNAVLWHEQAYCS